MKKTILCLTSYLLLLGCSKSATNNPTPDASITATSLVGKWEYMEYSTVQNTHAYYEFLSDGTVRYIMPGNPNSDPILPYSVEGNVLRLKRPSTITVTQPKDKECETYILPATFSTKLTCKNVGLNYCVFAPTGSETSKPFTLVKQ